MLRWINLLGRLGLAGLALALGCAGASGADSQGPSKTARMLAAGEPVTIVCVGDSVTGIYYHSGGRRAWSDLLAFDLSRLYPNARVTVINAGVSGNTSAQGLARMDADVLSHHPQLVVAMFGLNDLARGAGPREFRDHLLQIVDRSRQAGAEAILLTPNSIYPGDPERPVGGVAQYAETVRSAGAARGVAVADAFSAFERIRSVDRRAWEHLMSETIHPNLNGHAIFAEEVVWTLTGRRPVREGLPPLQPGLPRVRARLREHQPVRVVAMKPYDALIGPALRAVDPTANVVVTSWDPARKSLADLAAEAKAKGRFNSASADAPAQPDLVLLAVPPDAAALDAETYFREYSMIVNWTLPFGPGGWDYLAALPSAAASQLDPAQRAAEALAREVIQSKDLPYLEQSGGASLQSFLTGRLRSLLTP